MNWPEWGMVTRFHESTRLAFAREQRLWGELVLDNPDTAYVRFQSGERTYQATVAQHRDTVSNEWLLNASVLVYSYALAEAAAEDALGAGATANGGIEKWGTDLLKLAGNSWSTVHGGLSGLVEVGIVRNIVAHGNSIYTGTSINRFAATGDTPKWKSGDSVLLSYDDILEYRARLKSLLRNGKL